MITADHHDRASAGTSVPQIAPTVPAASAAGRLSAADPGLVAAERFLSRMRILSDLVCASLFLAVGIAAGFPLVWGLALHQTPMAVSAGCAEAMCLLVLLNRIFAPGAVRVRLVPFLAALEERPWVLAICLALAGCSAVLLIACWPGAA